MSTDIDILQLNTVTNNSTGRIMHDIQRDSDSRGYSTLSIVGRRKVYTDVPCVKYGNPISFWIHVGITTVFDRHGFGSYFYTRKIVDRIRQENPRVIHLHNIHGYWIHIPTLMRYLRDEYKGKIVWTFHDLWPITGHCAYYSAIGCDKWQSECSNCMNRKQYPISLLLDSSKRNYKDKKKFFSSLKNLTIVVPSDWMKSQVEQSFMREYPIKVINNGIDTVVFDYNRMSAENLQLVRKQYAIPENKRIILGVASIWDERKGLREFIGISEQVSDQYAIVLVGLNKRQIANLPNGIIGIERTENRDELVALYSLADIFINPSKEESFSLVTVEAQACGAPCIVNDVSAVGDLVNDCNGVVLHAYGIDDYVSAIREIEQNHYSRSDVRKTAAKYTNEHMLEKYLSLYGELLE